MIAVQSGAIDNVFGGEGSASGFDHHFRTTGNHSLYLGSGTYSSALRSDDLGIFPANRGVVGDAGARHPHAQHAAAVRLNLAHFFRLQQPQSGQAVGLSALEQDFQARDFFFAGGHDDFPADFVRQVVLAAKFHHGRGSLYAELRL